MFTMITVVAAVLALGACGTVADGPQISAEERAEQEAAIPDDAFVYEAVDLGLEGPTELPAGEVTLAMDNAGNLRHNLVIEELDLTVVETQAGEILGDTVTLEPGTYTLYCSIAGHRANMEVTIEVG